MSSKDTFFSREWLKDSKFSAWVTEVPDNRKKAHCKLCHTSFSLGNMGRGALNKHGKAKKHLNAELECKTMLTDVFKHENVENPQTSSKSLQPEVPDSEDASPSTSGHDESVGGGKQVQSAKKTTQLTQFVSREEVLRAEVLWALKKVEDHSSFCSANETGEILRKMFPDSDIASKFQMQRTKCTYLTIYGLAPFFKDMLVRSVCSADAYVLIYDESRNIVTKDEQMDLMVRFWDRSEVVTRYLDSKFLGHTTAKDLLDNFSDAAKILPSHKLIQVGSDGPNVAKKMYSDLIKQREGLPDHPDLINIGTCGLHTIHNSLRAGEKATDWELDKSLRAFFRLFDDSPAKRSDFKTNTSCHMFPLQWCPHRWIENVHVIERLIEVLPHVKKFVKAYKESNEPKGETFKTVKRACFSYTYEIKLKFFLSIALLLKPFLTTFQSDAPMMPFYAKELEGLLRNLLQRFVKRDVLDDAENLAQLIKLDLGKKANLLPIGTIDIGFGAKAAMTNPKLSELQKLEVRKNCQYFLLATARKIMNKSPGQFKMVQQLSALNPELMVRNASEATARFHDVLLLLMKAKWLTDRDCDNALSQFTSICSSERDKLEEYSSMQRLDTFYHGFLSQSNRHQELWKTVQLCLVLSHGQASIERGFSVNKDVLETNMGNETIVGLRTVHQAIKSAGGVTAVNITKQLLQSCVHARRRYIEYLDTKKEKDAAIRKRKENEPLEEELGKLKRRKRTLQEELKRKEEEADKTAQAAEDKQSLQHLQKFNDIRHIIRKKKEDLNTCKERIHEIDGKLGK